MVGRSGPGLLELTEAHRFPNEPVAVVGTLHWDILRLYAGVLDGLRAAAQSAPLASIGIDSWGVDYGLLDAAGALLGNPVHYRDARTDGILARLAGVIPPAELYAVTGIQQLPINTICQLAAAAGSPQLAAARTLLLIPDLIGYWLTGEIGAEETNASTTQLFDVRGHGWAGQLMDKISIPRGLFPPLRRPGDTVGELLPAVAQAIGWNGSGGVGPGPGPAGPGRDLAAPRVVAVGSHDTASAVVGVPAAGPDFAYISCGTWSLVGMELDQPVLTEASRAANFTNEAGIDGTIRYLRNVMGLWLLQESQRSWAAAGLTAGLEPLLAQAAAVPAFAAVIDLDDPVFLPPGGMPARIAAACAKTGQAAPASPAATVRCILDSLALAYRRAVAEVQELSGRPVSAVHIVGGGARNTLLCQLTADACGLPVIAGPVEAAALGNVLVQARALGAAPGGLAGMRALLRETQPLRHYQPSGNGQAWAAAARRLERI
ncbi:MAG: rhamnulokinase family protein [Actinomycetota bacterium]